MNAQSNKIPETARKRRRTPVGSEPGDDAHLARAAGLFETFAQAGNEAAVSSGDLQHWRALLSGDGDEAGPDAAPLPAGGSPGDVLAEGGRQLIGMVQAVLRAVPAEQAGPVIGALLRRGLLNIGRKLDDAAAASDGRGDHARQLLQAALEQTADSVIITDRQGVIEYVNKAFEQFTGYSTEEVTGSKPGVVRSGLHDRAFYQRLWSTILQGEAFRDVMINRRKDGSLYYEEKTITPLRDPASGEITHFVSTGKDITRQIEVEERLRYLVHYDALTNLPNRSLLVDRLGQWLARPHQDGRMAAILHVDLDQFQRANESYGHGAGDRLLVEAAHRLLDAVRPADTVARLGGDGFAVLLTDLDGVDQAAAYAHACMAAMRAPYEASGGELFLSASIGASVAPHDGTQPLELLAAAETALRRAKTGGRGGCEFYTADSGSDTRRRLQLESALHRALEREEFTLYYQPQMDLRDGRVAGAEALLRWRHPERGLVVPGEFIAVLEETGLILPVGDWVLRTAARTLRRWQVSGTVPVRVAVNVSALQLRAPGFAARAAAIVAEEGIRPADIEFEITESAMMHDMEQAVEVLAGLREQGFRLAVDDFGTGYSSLSYLRELPINRLKLAQPFVHGVPVERGDVGIVRAVIGISRSLGLEVIAEGVETEDQLLFLRNEGCHLIQGFLFSPALPEAEAFALMERCDVPTAR